MAEFPMFSPKGPYLTEQRVLYWQKVAVRELVANSVLAMAEFDVIEDVALPALVASLTSYVLTDHVMSRTQTAKIDVPRNTWQFFKADVLTRFRLGRWFVNRHPVKFNKWTQDITFYEDRNYVDSRILPEAQFGKPVIYETVDFKGWKYDGTA